MLRAATVTLAVLALTTSAFADGWYIESVDTASVVGLYTSITLDTSNNPHISYYDNAYDDLKYAYYNGSSWQIESVDTVGWVGLYTSIALDSSDAPYISYYDDTNDNLKYAYYDGSSWQIEDIDTTGDVGRWTSLALDASNNPHISYYDYTNGDLKYAYYGNSSWHIESVDTTGYVGRYTSIALDASDNPRISYYALSSHDLKYAYYDGSSWHIESVDTAGDVGRWTSIALDTSDNPHISYVDADEYPDDDLKYAYYDGSSWQIEDLGTPWWEEYTSIALDSSDNPRISYHNDVVYDLKYTYYDGASWQIESVDTKGDVGRFTSIALDSSDNPHISYFDETNKDLKYARYGPEDIGIILGHFSAKAALEGVIVNWAAENASRRIAGFNLYRSKKIGKGKAVTSREKLNAELMTGESPYTYLDATVEKGLTYSYWLKAIDVGGLTETFGPVECTWKGALPTTYALYQSRPNPAVGSAVIAFDLPEAAEVTLAVYDVSGRKVMTLADETLTAGTHERSVAGLPPGVYVYILDAGAFNAARNMVIVE